MTRADFEKDSVAWNGMGRFFATMRKAAIRVKSPSTLRLQELSQNDGLLIIQPHAVLPGAELVQKIQGGLRVAIADDVGTSDRFLRSFAITRQSPDLRKLMQVDGHRELLIAKPAYAHPLNQGVEALVTNMPVQLRHANLRSVLNFDAQQALTLMGNLGSGSLIAIGDSSIFINQMFTYRGNERFALNLAHYLLRDGEGTLYVVLPSSSWTMTHDEESARLEEPSLLKKLPAGSFNFLSLIIMLLVPWFVAAWVLASFIRNSWAAQQPVFRTSLSGETAGKKFGADTPAVESYIEDISETIKQLEDPLLRERAKTSFPQRARFVAWLRPPRAEYADAAKEWRRYVNAWRRGGTRSKADVLRLLQEGERLIRELELRHAPAKQ